MNNTYKTPHKKKKISEAFGILSIIIKAKQFNLIKSVKPLLNKLQQNGFRVSDTLIETILRITEEL